ncbi:pyridoxal phosphate-dependent transferase, partial [Dichotomocladium elegans]
YDLTSDTATVPTDDMFEVMKMASRGDDVMQANADVQSLEAYMADQLGQEAALFCVSGCMTNQLGLRVLLTQPPHSVLTDARAHVFQYECGGIAYHSQANVVPVMPKNGIYLTAEEVRANVNVDELCGAITRVISLENTLNGMVMPLEEIKRIRAVADELGLLMHLDGARLWNACAATGVPMREYGKLFDTVSICLSKGAGAPIGSILASSSSRIRRSRHLRKLMGGGWRQAGMLAAAARHCIDKVVPTLPETHALAAHLAKQLQALGIRLVLPCHTNMLFIDVSPLGFTIDILAEALAKYHIKINASPGATVSRIVLHYQIPPHAIQTFIDVATTVV